MKILKFFILTLLFTFNQYSYAQNCAEAFYTSKQGTRLSFEHYDDKNKLQTSQTQTMTSFKSTAGGFEAIMSVMMKDKKDKVIVDNRNFNVKCDNGVFTMDLSSFYGGEINSAKDMQMEVSGEGISYPSNLADGQSLPSGENEIKMKSGNMTLMTFRFKEINRFVEKKESITTPAGTFECYKITSESEIKVLFKRTIKSAIWMAKGVGIVRTETYNKKGEVEGYMILTKIEK